MKKLVLVLLTLLLIALSGCVHVKPEQPCNYVITYDGSVDTVYTDDVKIFDGSFGGTSLYYFYLHGEVVARMEGKNVLLKKLN